MRLKKKLLFLFLLVLLMFVVTACKVLVYSRRSSQFSSSPISTSSREDHTPIGRPSKGSSDHDGPPEVVHQLKKRYLSPLHVNASTATNNHHLGSSLKDSDKFPRVLIVGFAKTGTKALYEALKLHPQLSGPLKELRYFTEHYRSDGLGGVQAYLDKFQGPPPVGGYNIEKSPDYILSMKAAVRLKQAAYEAGVNPLSLKLVVMVRNPIVRSVSDFLELKSWSILNKVDFSNSFSDHVFDINGNIQVHSKIVNSSCYSYHIMNWFKEFAKDQFCYVNGDAFTTDPYNEIKSLENCLQLNPFYTQSNFVYNMQRGFYCFSSDTDYSKPICMSRSKGRKHPDIDHDTVDRLKLYYNPWNQQLYSIINRTDLNWESSESY